MEKNNPKANHLSDGTPLLGRSCISVGTPTGSQNHHGMLWARRAPDCLGRVAFLKYVLREPGAEACWAVSDFGVPVGDEVLSEGSGV